MDLGWMDVMGKVNFGLAWQQRQLFLWTFNVILQKCVWWTGVWCMVDKNVTQSIKMYFLLSMHLNKKYPKIKETQNKKGPLKMPPNQTVPLNKKSPPKMKKKKNSPI